MGAADLLLEGATFLTQDLGCPAASAVAVSEGRVVAVGESDALEGLIDGSTRRVHLGGRVVVPGFIDAHTHVWKVGALCTRTADLREVRSLAALAEELRRLDASLPAGAWLEGRGYNETRLEEGRRPSRPDLDAAAPGRPVFLTRTCGHIGVASSRALEAVGLNRDTDAPRGGLILRSPDGEPTGELHETAMRLVTAAIPPPDLDGYREMILAACRHLLSQGITGATDAGVGPELLEVYRQLDAAGELPCRIHAMAVRTPLDGAGVLPLPEASVTPRLRIDTVKLFADGGLSGGTAALSIPYRGDTGRGLLRLDREELVELARPAHEAGLRVAVHAIGDHAIEETLCAYEELQGDGPSPGHRIEHFGLPSAAQLGRAARLGVVAAPQAIFLAELATNFRQFLPDALLERTYPLRSMLRAGVRVALSSDAPVVRSDDPLRGIQAAVLRAAPGGEPLVPEEALTVAEALEAYTGGGAAASGEADQRGRIAPGHRADLAVLSGDPLSTPPEELHELRVEQTWLGGELVYEA